MNLILKLRDEERNVKYKIIAASDPTYVVAKRKLESQACLDSNRLTSTIPVQRSTEPIQLTKQLAAGH